MYSDNRMIQQLLSLMKQYGIRNVVVSPGSRHFPLIRSMEQDAFFRLYSVVDERSAGFFALGLIQQTGEPAALCCTSGTAAVNYASAMVEAFYQGLPLVALTSDRRPELLNQKEDQMIRQHDVFQGYVRYEGQLQQVHDALSEWYTNRIINEAFMELDHFGCGPVHLNFPIESHHTDRFQVKDLPVARKIERIYADSEAQAWEARAARLKGKRVLVLWGQASPMPKQFVDAFDAFAKAYDCAILADKLANCHHRLAVKASFMSFHAMQGVDPPDLAPDVVITLFGNFSFNNEVKSFLAASGRPFECWDVGRREVMDPFRRLTTVFATQPHHFFARMAALAERSAGAGYHAEWSKLSARVTEPKVAFGEIHAVGALLKALPKGSVLQIANSLPIRMTELFPSDPDITYFCNRGVNGIDGCMSTAVGYAAASDRPVFLVIGDLTFFYDMNALWNRHLPANFRILLLNNQGGGVMHVPLDEALGPTLGRHVSAEHRTDARGWAESLGFDYVPVTDLASCEAGIAALTDLSSSRRVLVEAFSRKQEDVKAYKAYLRSYRKPATLQDKLKRRVRLVFPNL
jgi:2-succinyl-5-enolpyruvyl-6-hydroxy-3-cyclohexene-1-carboxylate synthase